MIKHGTKRMNRLNPKTVIKASGGWRSTSITHVITYDVITRKIHSIIPVERLIDEVDMRCSAIPRVKAATLATPINITKGLQIKNALEETALPTTVCSKKYSIRKRVTTPKSRSKRFIYR
jgi:hypothetical protein